MVGEGKKMKDENHDRNERVIILGVLLLLGACIVVNVVGVGDPSGVSNVIAGLLSALSVIVGHVMGKNSALAQPKEKQPQASEKGENA